MLQEMTVLSSLMFQRGTDWLLCWAGVRISQINLMCTCCFDLLLHVGIKKIHFTVDKTKKVHLYQATKGVNN